MKPLGFSLVGILLSSLLVAPLVVNPTYAITESQNMLPPEDLNATAVSGTQVFLIWSPVNDLKNLINYKIESSPSCTGSFTSLANTTDPFFLATGLTNGTCYQFRVSTIAQTGISASSNVTSVTTLSIPSPPSDLQATKISPIQADLSWKAPSSNGGTKLTGYEVQRKNSCDSKFVTIGSVVNSTTYSDAGLSPNTCYQYQILATNAIGQSTPSNYTVIITPQNNETLSRDAPTGLQVNAISDSSLRLTWNPPTNKQSSIYGYVIQRNGTVLSNNFSTKTTFVDTGLRPSHLEVYRVAAWNYNDANPFSNNAGDITPKFPPPQPTKLKAMTVSSSQINLVWQEPPNNSGLSIKGYAVERSIDMGIHWTNVIKNTGNVMASYSDGGLLPGTTYEYRVSAISSAGKSPPSNTVSQTTLNVPTSLADAPSDLTVFTVSDSQLMLFWNPPIYSGQGSITGYQIQRNDTVLVNNTASQDTSFIDDNLMPNHKERYRVAAWNQVGLGMFSDTAWGITDNATVDLVPISEVNQTNIITNSTNQTTIDPPPTNQTTIDPLPTNQSNTNPTNTDPTSTTSDWDKLFNEQRMKEIHAVGECNTEIMTASGGNAMQVDDDCSHKFKVINQKLQEIKQDFTDSQNKLEQKLAKLKGDWRKPHDDDNEQMGPYTGIASGSTTNYEHASVNSNQHASTMSSYEHSSSVNSYAHGSTMSSYERSSGMNSHGNEGHGGNGNSHESHDDH